MSLYPAFITRAFDVLIVLLRVSIVDAVLLVASAVFASVESPFGFDESGKLYQRDTWSPMSPNSNRYAEEDRRQYNAWINAETLRKNEQLIQDYHGTKRSAPAYGSTNAPFLVYPETGAAPKLCQRSFNSIYCQ